MEAQNYVDTPKELTHISLCAGYGGIDLGLHRVYGERLRTVAFSEIEAFAVENLVSKMEAGLLPPAPVWTDLRTFPWADFQGIDILSGGFPCQPFSAAGKRNADSDPRHLFPAILEGIRHAQPRLVFLENVEGIISAKLAGDGWRDPAGTPVLLHVLRELERVGYRATAGLFSASETGAPHQRKRIFILAYDQQQGLEGLSEFCPSLCRSNKRSFIGNGCSREELANDSSAGLGGKRPCQFCGYEFDHELLGKYGCPNCEGSPGELVNAASAGGSEQRRSIQQASGCDTGEAQANWWPPETWPHAGSANVWPSRPGELVNAEHAGHYAAKIDGGHPAGSDSRWTQEPQVHGQPARGCRDVWPSRPGEPQHAWEPPRVVGGVPAKLADFCSGDQQPRHDAAPAGGQGVGPGQQGEDANADGGSGLCGGDQEAGTLVDAKSQRAGQRSELRGEECGSRSALPRDIEQPSEAALANDHRAHARHGEQRPERTLGDLSGGCGEGRGTEGMAHTHGGRGEEPEHQQANLPSEPSGGNAEAMGNSTQRQDHGRESRDLGLAAGEGRCGNDAVDGTSEGMADTESAKRWRASNTGNCGRRASQAGRPDGSTRYGQTQPPLGRDADGSADWLDHAELFTTCDNRTDELRLLGNGVVPATAERAFRTLFSELCRND